jgi:hypothetical protein
MPIVINEIQITATIGERSPKNMSSSVNTEPGEPAINDADRQTIIAECIDEVLRILKDKQER